MATSANKVLLTGANGFLASHIVQELITQGYHIVGTVRTEEKAQSVISLHPSWKDHITWVYIADIGAAHAYDEVFQAGPFNYIIHNASPVDFSVTDFEAQMIGPAVKGTMSLLEAAQKSGGTQLKRIVITGSTSSVSNYFQAGDEAHNAWTEADWNQVTAKYAIDNNDITAAYEASKTLAEQAAWKFTTDNELTFDVTVLNPYVIIGPMLQPLAGPEQMPITNAFPVYNFMNGTYKDIDGLLFPAWHFVDVRDVARAHVLSLTNSAASNKRILLVSGLITPQIVINIVRKNFPNLHNRVIEGNPSELLPKGIKPTDWDVARSYEIFGQDWKYIDIDKTVTDTVNDMLSHEKRWASRARSG